METHIENLELKTLKGQEVNARFMRGDMFRQLVANLERDGALTSVPLVRPDGDGFRIISGHHRVKAAVEAGIEHADCMVMDTPITRQQEVALVLSHNSLSGEDDPATLLNLFAELDNADWRDYSGLDDKQLKLLDEISVEPLNEANLQYSTIQLVFLPSEADEAAKCLEEAHKKLPGASRWLAAITQYEQALDALETTREAYSVDNVATAFGLILEVFKANMRDLDAGWLDENGDARDPKKPVPMETVLGSRMLPAKSAQLVRMATKKAIEQGDIKKEEPWELVELACSLYLEN